MLTTMPRLFAGATSDRYKGATTVRPPAPSPPQIRAKSMSPRMPEEKVCRRLPVIQMIMDSCQQRRRPRRSHTARIMRAPIAAPSTPKDEMLAFRSARPLALPGHCDVLRPKSFLKAGSDVEEEKPPSSYPGGYVSVIEDGEVIAAEKGWKDYRVTRR